ncbi:Electron transport protein SCO1/SenC [Croceitalea dokdonensis DOKDO 023]|uniref:Electron transport protein SCO1/SenC n=1 Tax=Croceitalea dokdonensis DOKDO 023 TaxID=1300341 RepID=A0A0N8H3S2_9FLAO|nr:SCO family protein [Croceitalea dokdonensis]KPM31364.1 Electron transport protein SCO1/SenC [Croceitalea dokdonensis DOKDO 023]
MPTGTKTSKKYTYVWISAIVLIFGAFAVYEITKRIKSGDVVKNDRMAGAATMDKLSFITSNGRKRKVPSFEFLNQDSVLVSNEDYLGKVYVVDFFFTTCPTICPIMTSNLKELENMFLEEEDFGIASFTINPRYDTPSVLTSYAEKFGVRDTDWNFLTGDKEAIYKLSREGFYILAAENKEAPGGFEHSGMFALVDKNGFIRSRLDKFGNPIIYYRGTVTEKQGVNKEGEVQQITMLKEDIQKLLSE